MPLLAKSKAKVLLLSNYRYSTVLKIVRPFFKKPPRNFNNQKAACEIKYSVDFYRASNDKRYTMEKSTRDKRETKEKFIESITTTSHLKIWKTVSS